MTRPPLVCIGCNGTPKDFWSYSEEATDTGLSPDDYVWQEEGTLNRDNGHFLCDGCYIKAGMPTAPWGWKAP
jgi:hypothetical protein